MCNLMYMLGYCYVKCHKLHVLPRQREVKCNRDYLFATGTHYVSYLSPLRVLTLCMLTGRLMNKTLVHNYYI